MNWEKLYALVNENIKNAVSGLYKPAGDVTFAELPALSQSILGYTYTVTDAFTTDIRFTDYDTETQTGHSFPADTEVAVIVTGTTENPVYMFNVMGGIMDGYATKGDLDNYVEKEAGKSLSTNDYTDTDKALVQDSPITTTATGSDLTLSTAEGNLNALTVYGKSEIVDGAIVSAGEGWSTVDLGTLTWYMGTSSFYAAVPDIYIPQSSEENNKGLVCARYNLSPNTSIVTSPDKSYLRANGMIYIKDTDYTDATAFTAAMSGVLLTYQLADSTQGNTIAVKTDDGTGINGTMATFTTGTPLRGITGGARDVMTWNGSAGTVTKKRAEVDLSSLEWTRITASTNPMFYASVSNSKTNSDGIISATAYTKYPNTYASNFGNNYPDKSWCMSSANNQIYFRDDSILTETDFTTAMSGVKLVYELATPTTEQLTTAENASIAGLRTFEPTTHAQNNAGANMTIEAYAGTANGKAVNELKQDVQSEISELKITQSVTLTLTVADWSSNTQTVTYAHDTAKRNVIDVDPASVEEWASCGVLATAETASGITFKCSTVPENALSFKVTSMGVN